MPQAASSYFSIKERSMGFCGGFQAGKAKNFKILLSTALLGFGLASSAFAAGPYSLDGGRRFVAAVRDDGALYLWGDNTFKQLGNNSTTPELLPMKFPVTGFAMARSGNNHVVALTKGGKVWSWGDGFLGQAGPGSVGAPGNIAQPYELPGLSDIGSVGAESSESAALSADGTKIWAWGDMFAAFEPKPLTLPAGKTFSKIFCGCGFSAALTTTGEVWMWGSNDLNQFGVNPPSDLVTVPVLAGGGLLPPIVDVALGSDETLFLDNQGYLWGMGLNMFGQLGSATTDPITVPTKFESMGKFTKISMYMHTVALKADGTVWAWGLNEDGQIGNGEASATPVLTPFQVPGLSNIVAVDAGQHSSYALAADGTVWAWGDNSQGQLGINSTVSSLTPAKVLLTGATNFDLTVSTDDGGSSSGGCFVKTIDMKR